MLSLLKKMKCSKDGAVGVLADVSLWAFVGILFWLIWCCGASLLGKEVGALQSSLYKMLEILYLVLLLGSVIGFYFAGTSG